MEIKKLFVFFTFSIFWLSAAAQNQNQKTNDCKKIVNKTQRLKCFDSADQHSQEKEKDQIVQINNTADTDIIEKEKQDRIKSFKKFENAIRNGNRIIGATEAGVSYVRFSELLGDFAGEIAFLKQDATTPLEMESIENLNKSLEIYHDSIKIWADIIAANSNKSMQLEKDYIIFGFYPNTAAIVSKYSLPWKKDTSFFSGPDSIYGPEARSILWDKSKYIIKTTQKTLRDGH